MVASKVNILKAHCTEGRCQSCNNIAFSQCMLLPEDDRKIICDSIKNESFVTIKRKNHFANRYVGCFKDTKERVLKKNIKLGGRNQNSVRNCIEACRQEGYVYAGVEFVYQCFCGNRYPDLVKFPQLNENKCDMNCATGTNIKCGGSWTISVYETGNESK